MVNPMGDPTHALQAEDPNVPRPSFAPERVIDYHRRLEASAENRLWHDERSESRAEEESAEEVEGDPALRGFEEPPPPFIRASHPPGGNTGGNSVDAMMDVLSQRRVLPQRRVGYSTQPAFYHERKEEARKKEIAAEAEKKKKAAADAKAKKAEEKEEAKKAKAAQKTNATSQEESASSASSAGIRKQPLQKKKTIEQTADWGSALQSSGDPDVGTSEPRTRALRSNKDADQEAAGVLEHMNSVDEDQDTDKSIHSEQDVPTPADQISDSEHIDEASSTIKPASQNDLPKSGFVLTLTLTELEWVFAWKAAWDALPLADHKKARNAWVEANPGKGSWSWAFAGQEAFNEKHRSREVDKKMGPNGMKNGFDKKDFETMLEHRKKEMAAKEAEEAGAKLAMKTKPSSGRRRDRKGVEAEGEVQEYEVDQAANQEIDEDDRGTEDEDVRGQVPAGNQFSASVATMTQTGPPLKKITEFSKDQSNWIADFYIKWTRLDGDEKKVERGVWSRAHGMESDFKDVKRPEWWILAKSQFMIDYPGFSVKNTQIKNHKQRVLKIKNPRPVAAEKKGEQSQRVLKRSRTAVNVEEESDEGTPGDLVPVTREPRLRDGAKRRKITARTGRDPDDAVSEVSDSAEKGKSLMVKFRVPTANLGLLKNTDSVYGLIFDV